MRKCHVHGGESLTKPLQTSANSKDTQPLLHNKLDSNVCQSYCLCTRYLCLSGFDRTIKRKHSTIKSSCFSFLGLNNARIPMREPAAHMSTGPTGGGGRENLLYFAAVGTTFIGAGIYVSWHSQRISFFMVKCIICILGLTAVDEIKRQLERACLAFPGVPDSKGRQGEISGPY